MHGGKAGSGAPPHKSPGRKSPLRKTRPLFLFHCRSRTIPPRLTLGSCPKPRATMLPAVVLALAARPVSSQLGFGSLSGLGGSTSRGGSPAAPPGGGWPPLGGKGSPLGGGDPCKDGYDACSCAIIPGCGWSQGPRMGELKCRLGGRTSCEECPTQPQCTDALLQTSAQPLATNPIRLYNGMNGGRTCAEVPLIPTCAR